MAELDTASIILLVLALAIAPFVLPWILRIISAEKKAQDEHIDFCDRNRR